MAIGSHGLYYFRFSAVDQPERPVQDFGDPG